MESLVQSPIWGVMSLLFFFCFFVGVLAWVMRPGSKDHYDKASRIPLEDEK